MNTLEILYAIEAILTGAFVMLIIVGVSMSIAVGVAGIIKNRQEKYVEAQYGARLYFSNTGINWEKHTLYGYYSTTQKWDTNKGMFRFCFEYQLKEAKHIPEGWTNPYTDKEAAE